MTKHTQLAETNPPPTLFMSANSCSLWSTIREANDAYSRRKLTDFKRLKRSLMKPMGATISENGYEQQKQHHQQQLQKQARRRRRKEKGPPIRRVRRQAQERLENLNEPNGRPRMGAIGRQPMRSGGGEQSVQGAAIHSNGHEGDGDRNIDGKLVAPLSWLDGAVVAPADSEAGPGLEPVEDTHRERRYDDIETARRGWPANGQQDLYPSNNANDDHDEVQLDHRHEMDIRHPNSGLPMVNSFDKRRASRASPLEFQAELSRHDEELEGDNLSNDSSQNSGSRHRRRRDTAADRSPTTNNANKQTSGDGAGVPGQGQRRRSAVAEQTRIPFNYANERNLNPHLEEVPAGRTTRRRHGARAQAIVESFDLHPETFDSGETTRAGRFKVGHEPGLELVETKAELAAVDTPVPDGRPSLAHLDKMALLHQQSQRIDIERASRRRQVVNSKSAGFEDGDLEGARQRRQGPTREMALAARLGPNWTPNPSVGNLIDNSDGRVNTLAIDVIDGNLETSQAADQDDSRHSDERPNEVSSQLEPTSTGQLPPARAGSGQLEAASKLFDSRDGDQTNSSSSSSSSFKSQRPDWPLPFGWISASEFVTEKSNIRLSEWAPRARRGKFNNIATVREPTTGKAAATPTESLTRRLDSDNFINFHRAAHKRHLEQQQQQQRAWRHGKRLLDDQSDRRRPPDGRNTRLAHDNDDALSIAGAVGGRRRRRQPYESQRESGHKLQLSRTEQRRRRFSRSDKSARSSGGVVASGPLRRHRRLASGAAGDQSDTEIPSAGRVQVIQATPPSGRGEGSTLRSISVQYESTTHGLDDDAEPARSDAVLDNLELQDEIVTSPGVREPPVMPNGRTSNVDNSNISTGDDDEEEDEQQEDEGEDDQDEDDDSIRGRLPGPMGNVGGTANDENLLWTAGQYLYMHMRAFAASSMYGVQVDVEWSNENEWMGINRTMDDGEQAPSSFPGELSRPDFNGSERVHGGSRDFGARTNAIAPIATIELVSGQDLHLQCTAQALGRLPEVNWYRRVERVPDHIPEEMRKQMVRSLGDDIFWPVTSLDLLDDESLGEPSENFVCSQSVTIFDNLLNQTFTVVNSLKLSEHSHEQTGGLNLAPTSQVRVEPNNERHHDLYACMVTADVRHECATLGVNIRHASSSKLPPGLSKRLLAHSMSELPSNIEPKRVPTRIIDVNEDLLREESNYDFLRQSQLVVPFGGVWVPIRKNGTHSKEDEAFASTIYPNSRYSINPFVLSLMIASLSSLLVALIYFTMRSYRALTSFHMDEECFDCANKRHLPEGQVEPLDDNGQQLINNETGGDSALKIASSYCRFDPKKMVFKHGLKRIDDEDDGEDDYDGNLDKHDENDYLDTRQPPSSETFLTVDFKPKLGVDLSQSRKCPAPVFYEAHFHDSDERLICNEIPASLLSDMISTEIKSELKYTYNDGCVSNKPCCTSGGTELPVVEQTGTSWNNCGQIKINMVANPLNKI